MATKKQTSTRSKTKKPASKKATKTAAASNLASRSQKVKIVSLHKWNIIVAVLLAVQAVAILIIGKVVILPVVTHYLAVDSLASQFAGHQVLAPAVHHLADVDIRYLLVCVLLVSAAIHYIIASIRRSKYEDQLSHRVNTLRWVDYSLSAGVMLVLISMLNGVYDIAILISVFVLVILLHFLGYIAEAKTVDQKTKIQLFVGLTFAGAAVWTVVFGTLKSDIIYGSGLHHIVYWIDGIIFAITLGLAYNIWQILRNQGKWEDYIFGERIFMALSFVAKTTLAWLVFVGFLR